MPTLAQSYIFTAKGPYMRPVIIDNTQNSNALSNYQIQVILDTASLISAGKMRSDCGDIRFMDSDGATQLNYWVESDICNTSSTRIWVNVPSIPASSKKTILLYYGNPYLTSASNGKATFDFFDDFISLDTSVWNALTGSGGSVSVSNSLVRVSVANLVTKSYTLTDGIIEYRGYSEVEEISGIFRASQNSSYDVFTSTGTVGGHGYYNGSGTPSWSHAITVGNVNKASVVSPITTNKWYKYRAVLVGTQITFTRFDNNWTQQATVSYNNSGGLTSGYIGFRVDGLSGDVRAADYDWIRVRKYTNPEPTANLGSEEYASKPPDSL